MSVSLLPAILFFASEVFFTSEATNSKSLRYFYLTVAHVQRAPFLFNSILLTLMKVSFTRPATSYSRILKPGLLLIHDEQASNYITLDGFMTVCPEL